MISDQQPNKLFSIILWCRRACLQFEPKQVGVVALRWMCINALLIRATPPIGINDLTNPPLIPQVRSSYGSWASRGPTHPACPTWLHHCVGKDDPNEPFAQSFTSTSPARHISPLSQYFSTTHLQFCSSIGLCPVQNSCIAWDIPRGLASR